MTLFDLVVDDEATKKKVVRLPGSSLGMGKMLKEVKMCEWWTSGQESGGPFRRNCSTPSLADTCNTPLSDLETSA